LEFTNFTILLKYKKGNIAEYYMQKGKLDNLLIILKLLKTNFLIKGL